MWAALCSLCARSPLESRHAVSTKGDANEKQSMDESAVRWGARLDRWMRGQSSRRNVGERLRLERTPTVHRDDPRGRRRHVVSRDGERRAADVFEALSDGRGGVWVFYRAGMEREVGATLYPDLS